MFCLSDIRKDFMRFIKKTTILILFAVALLSACSNSDTADADNTSVYMLSENKTELTDASKSADNTQLIQKYSDILYGIFKNYDVATPHTYEQYFTESDISPYYIGEMVDIDVGEYSKNSECTTITFADIDGDNVPEMCLSRMEPQENFTNLDWIDVYKPDGTCVGTFISGQLWIANGKIYACAYDLTYGSVTDISDNFMYVYCTLGLPTLEYSAHDIITGTANGIVDIYDYSPEELQSSMEFIDDSFQKICTEYLGTNMSELFVNGSPLHAVTKSIILPNTVDYNVKDIAAVLETILEEYLNTGIE